MTRDVAPQRALVAMAPAYRALKAPEKPRFRLPGRHHIKRTPALIQRGRCFHARHSRPRLEEIQSSGRRLEASSPALAEPPAVAELAKSCACAKASPIAADSLNHLTVSIRTANADARLGFSNRQRKREARMPSNFCPCCGRLRTFRPSNT